MRRRPLDRESARQRVSHLQPLPSQLVTALGVLHSGWLWVVIAIAALARASHLNPWDMAVCSLFIVPAVFVLYRIASKLHADTALETTPLPASVADDPVVQQAVARLAAGGGVRRCHRQVIDAYVQTMGTMAP